jgi:hypothetical protein
VEIQGSVRDRWGIAAEVADTDLAYTNDVHEYISHGRVFRKLCLIRESLY